MRCSRKVKFLPSGLSGHRLDADDRKILALTRRDATGHLSPDRHQALSDREPTLHVAREWGR